MNRLLIVLVLFVGLFPLEPKDYWNMYCIKETRTSAFMEFDTLKEVDAYMYRNNLEKVFLRKCGDTVYEGYCPKTKDCSQFGSSDRKGNRLPRRN